MDMSPNPIIESTAADKKSKALQANIADLQNRQKRKLEEIDLLGEEILRLDGAILRSKRMKTMRKLDQSCIFEFVETEAQLRKLLDLFTRVVNGEISDGKDVIIKMKEYLGKEPVASASTDDAFFMSQQNIPMSAKDKTNPMRRVVCQVKSFTKLVPSKPIMELRTKEEKAAYSADTNFFDNEKLESINFGFQATPALPDVSSNCGGYQILDSTTSRANQLNVSDNNVPRLPPEMLERIFSYMRKDDLMPLRLVCKDWKQEIDTRLERIPIQCWMHATVKPHTFSSLQIIINEFPRISAMMRVCSAKDILNFPASSTSNGVFPQHFRLPGKSVLIGSPRSAITSRRSIRRVGTNIQYQQRPEAFPQINIIDYIPYLLLKLGYNLRTLVLSNFSVDLDMSPGQILICFRKILSALTNVSVLILNNAFASLRRKALRSNGSPIHIKKSEPKLQFPNFKKLVVNGGSMDVVEYSFYQIGPFLKDLCIINPFTRQNNSIHSTTLTPLKNQIGMFTNLQKLCLEFDKVENYGNRNWNEIATILENKLPRLITLRVVLLNDTAFLLPNLIGLASKFPALKELMIFMGSRDMAAKLLPPNDVIKIKTEGLLNLRRLCFGTNVLRSDSLGGLLVFLPLMKNVEVIEFHYIGYHSVLHSKSWLRNACSRFQLFEKLSHLKKIRASLPGSSVEILKESVIAL